MKHAVKRMMVILAACGVLAGGFLACQNDVESPVAYYTVSFNSDGGSFVAAQSVQSGKTAVEPKSPTKEAYTFEGWRKDGAAFDFATPITADTTLIAAWQAVKPETPRAEEGATESLDDTPADTTPSDKDNSDDSDNNGGTGDNGDTGDNGNNDGTGDNGDTGDNGNNGNNGSGNADTTDNTSSDDITGNGGSSVDDNADNNDNNNDDSTPNTPPVIETYTVYYEDGVDGEDITVPASATYRVGETVTLGTAGKRTSYTFMHWKDASGTTYASGSTIIMGGADITLTAVWNFAGILITENDTEAEINEKIQGMTTSGVVKVTGYMPRERLMLIDVTLKNYHKTDSVYIYLDISDTTGLTSLLGDRIAEFAEEATSIFVYPYWDWSHNKDKYRSIALPKQGLTKIETAAFYGLGNLESVIIPDGVTSIDDSAFGWCEELKNITIPDGVTSIGVDAFYRCDALTSVVIPDGVTSIGAEAFYDCKALTSVVIPDGVTIIGASTFYGCNALTSVVVPDSVKTIGDKAFSTADGIAEVTIGAGVEEIGYGVFTPTARRLGGRIILKNTTGWRVSGNKSDYSISIDASELADPESAWSCFTLRYSDKCWKRFPDSGE